MDHQLIVSFQYQGGMHDALTTTSCPNLDYEGIKIAIEYYLRDNLGLLKSDFPLCVLVKEVIIDDVEQNIEPIRLTIEYHENSNPT